MKPVLTTLLVLIFSLSGYAEETKTNASDPKPIQIVGLQVPWLLDPEKPGPYNDVADALLNDYPVPITFEIQPLKRAMRHFFEGDAECFLMGDTDEAYFKGTPLADTPIIVSDPFNTVAMRIFSYGAGQPFSSIEQITNRRVAVDLGVGGIVRILKVIPSLTQAFDALNADQVHAMLTKGRAEAALMMDYDYALYAARHPRKAPLQFDPEVSVQPADDAVMCKKNDRTTALVDHINSRIGALRQSGELKEMLYPTNGVQK